MMTNEQYYRWKREAYQCLLHKYSNDEALRIVDWFDNLSGVTSRQLVGTEMHDCLQAVWQCMNHFTHYDTMFMRLWLFAPYILELKKD